MCSLFCPAKNDGAYDVLNATLVSSADADPLVFEVISPGCLSTFSVVKVGAPKPATSTPTSLPTPVPTEGQAGILVLIGALVVGTVAGMASMVLWFLAR